MRSFAMCSKGPMVSVLLSILLTAHGVSGGILCDGTGDFLLSTNENSYDFVDQTWTVCVRFTTSTTGSIRILVGKGNTSPRWQLGLQSAGDILASIKNAAGEDIGVRSSTTIVTDGLPHSVCVVYTTHSTVRDNNTQTIYVDGFINQDPQQHTGTGGFSQNSDALNICRLGPAGFLFIGTVEEVVIWCGDIGATAVAQYHSGGIKRAYIANPLISYWPLWDCAAGATCTTFADEGRTSTLTSTGAVGSPMLIPMRGEVQ